MDSLIDNFNSKCIINKTPSKGDGAGGSKTNLKGLQFEIDTELSTHYDVMLEVKKPIVKKIKFKNSNKIYFNVNKGNLIKFLDEDGYVDNKIIVPNGCKQPDECYVDYENKRIFIIEKKTQGTGGSVCEKLQTSIYKKNELSRIYPQHQIIYIWCLDVWFKESKKCLAEFNFFDRENIPYFLVDTKDTKNIQKYKYEIIKFIQSF